MLVVRSGPRVVWGLSLRALLRSGTVASRGGFGIIMFREVLSRSIIGARSRPAVWAAMLIFNDIRGGVPAHGA